MVRRHSPAHEGSREMGAPSTRRLCDGSPGNIRAHPSFEPASDTMDPTRVSASIPAVRLHLAGAGSVHGGESSDRSRRRDAPGSPGTGLPTRSPSRTRGGCARAPAQGLAEALQLGGDPVLDQFVPLGQDVQLTFLLVHYARRSRGRTRLATRRVVGRQRSAASPVPRWRAAVTVR